MQIALFRLEAIVTSPNGSWWRGVSRLYERVILPPTSFRL